MLDQDDKLPVEESNSTAQISENSEETKKQTDSSQTPESSDAIVKQPEVENVTEVVEKSSEQSKPETEKVSDAVEETSNSTEASQEKTPSTTTKVIDAIDDKIAESSENIEHAPIEMLDYNSFSLEDLVAELSKLVKESQVQSIYNNVNKIKNAFNLKFGELLKKEKEAFLKEGGNIVDFSYSNPIKSTYNSILYDYKVKRNEFYANQEKQLKDNLQAKLDLIEELKHLIDHADGSTMYKLFKNIR